MKAIYGVIIESKQEQPLVMEGKLMTYEEASERMDFFMADKNIIRVAMFKAVYETGNETLLPKEKENE